VIQTLLVLSSIGLLAGLLLTWWIHSQHNLSITVVPSPVLDGPMPFISVIVPARNERRNIQRCISALLGQTYPNYEIIVVDDRSSDGTSQLLYGMLHAPENQKQLLRVLRGTDLPQGWSGKPHALVQGVETARGEWLCFIDADTFASPELLASAYATARQHSADLFSVLTSQELGSFWEKTILPLVFTALAFGFPASRVNDPGQPDAIANGQFILVNRAVYASLGGHAAVRERIDEDKALAELVKHGGGRLIVADGRQVVRTRMYTSLPEIWEGWTKNIYLGLQDRLWLLMFGALMGLMAALLLPFWLVGGLVWANSGGGLPAALIAAEAIVLWAYLLIVRVRACRAFEISPLYAITLPLGALLFTGMMLQSAFNVLSGRGVRWKGRTYTRH
jgi:chlorobactene glucosyltransferase